MDKKFELVEVGKVSNKERIFKIRDNNTGNEQWFSREKLFNTLFRNPSYYDCVLGMKVSADGRILTNRLPKEVNVDILKVRNDICNIITNEVYKSGCVGINLVYEPDHIFKAYSFTSRGKTINKELTLHVDKLMHQLQYSMVNTTNAWVSNHHMYMIIRKNFIQQIIGIFGDKYAVLVYKDDRSVSILIADQNRHPYSDQDTKIVKQSCKWMADIMDRYIQYFQMLYKTNPDKFRGSRAEKAWTQLDNSYLKLSHGKHLSLSDKNNLTTVGNLKLLIVHYHTAVDNSWAAIDADLIEQQENYIPAWLHLNDKMVALLSAVFTRR